MATPLSADVWEQLQRVGGDYAEMHDGQYVGIVYVVHATAAEWVTVNTILKAYLAVDAEKVEQYARDFRHAIETTGIRPLPEQRERAQSLVDLMAMNAATLTDQLRTARTCLAAYERVVEMIEAEEAA